MATCRCPNKKCEDTLQWEQIMGIRVYTEGKYRRKIFNAYCPTCNEHMQVNEIGKKHQSKYLKE